VGGPKKNWGTAVLALEAKHKSHRLSDKAGGMPSPTLNGKENMANPEQYQINKKAKSSLSGQKSTRVGSGPSETAYYAIVHGLSLEPKLWESGGGFCWGFFEQPSKLGDENAQESTTSSKRFGRMNIRQQKNKKLLENEEILNWGPPSKDVIEGGGAKVYRSTAAKKPTPVNMGSC